MLSRGEGSKLLHRLCWHHFFRVRLFQSETVLMKKLFLQATGMPEGPVQQNFNRVMINFQQRAMLSLER